jgi:hypothetical protein
VISGEEYTQQVYGIARMVQVSTSPLLMLLDLTVRFPGYPITDSSNEQPSPSPSPSQEYDVYVSSTGDLSDPPRSTGKPKISITRISPDVETGYADSFIELPIGLWDIIGRAMVIEPVIPKNGGLEGTGKESQILNEGLKGFRKGRLGILAGVIARSSGAWGNEVSWVGRRMWTI